MWRFGGADGADDAFADAGDDGFFGGTADELVEIGADRDAGFHFELHAVLGDGVERGRLLFFGSGQSMTLGFTLV